jgi:deoxyribonuclease-4
VRVGSHVSIRNGYLGAAKTAHAMGATAYQYFPKNPRGLAIKTFSAADAAACQSYCQEHDIQSIAHAPYPANIAVGDERMRKVIEDSLLNDLEIVEACGSVGLVVHFGKYKGKDALQGYKNSLQCLNNVLSRWEGRSQILIENQAGEGTDMGLTLDECISIRKLCQYPEKIGFCLDTCHLFAGGVWDGANWHEVLQHGSSIGYFSLLKAVHLNDSLHPSGSKRDRHANIGRGQIGEAAMKQFLASPGLTDLPIVLETPTGADGTHYEEIALVKAWGR